LNISNELREKLVNEIMFVVEKIRTEPDIRKKVYYYSAIYGEMSRVINLSFDRQLLFAHNVLNNSYQLLRARTDSLVLARDSTVDIPGNLFDRICTVLTDLGERIARDQDLYKPLEDISCMTYITTGNGFYLFQKGILHP